MSYGVWRYDVHGGLNSIEMPWDSHLLHVAGTLLPDRREGSTGELWVLTDPDWKVKRKFRIVCVLAGVRVDHLDLTAARYLGMYHSLYGSVLHAFDITEQWAAKTDEEIAKEIVQ